MATQTASDLRHIQLARRAAANGEARRLRLSHSLTQGEVGARVGRTAAAVSLWESGRRRPLGRAALLYGRLIASWLVDDGAMR